MDTATTGYKDIDQDIEDINEEMLYDTFFGNESGYYKNRLMRMRNGTNAIFNGYAFFLGVLWFAYRKMYVEVAIIILALIILQVLLELSGFVNTGIDKLSTLICAFILGYTGNYLYIKKAIRTVEKAKEIYINPGDRLTFLEKEGGVSILMPILLVAGIVALMIGALALIEFA